MPGMDAIAKICAAGHCSLVGTAIKSNLQTKDYANQLLRTDAELDLTNQTATDAIFVQGKSGHVLLDLGSSLSYPKIALQPMEEAYALTGPLEPTNRAYAMAEFASLGICWSYNGQYGARYPAELPTVAVATAQMISESAATTIKPDGRPRKLLTVDARQAAKWVASAMFTDGLASATTVPLSPRHRPRQVLCDYQ